VARIQFLEEGHHVKQFFVFGLASERGNGDAVAQVEGKTDYRVVDNDNLLQIPVSKDPQVFNVHSWCGVDAMLPVQSVRDYLTIVVNEVKHRVGVDLLTCCKHANLK